MIRDDVQYDPIHGQAQGRKVAKMANFTWPSKLGCYEESTDSLVWGLCIFISVYSLRYARPKIHDKYAITVDWLCKILVHAVDWLCTDTRVAVCASLHNSNKITCITLHYPQSLHSIVLAKMLRSRIMCLTIYEEFKFEQLSIFHCCMMHSYAISSTIWFTVTATVWSK